MSAPPPNRISPHVVNLGRATLALLLTLTVCLPAAARQECPATPPPVREVKSANIYGSGGDLRRGVDVNSSKERARLVKPVSDYMQLVAQLADEAVEQRSDASGRCLIDSLKLWAAQSALLDEPNNEAARKELIWNTAGIALAYLRVRHLASPAEAAMIEAWISVLAQGVVGRYGRSARHDNVFFWTGLVAAAAASTTGNVSLWTDAERIHEVALREVDSRGALPLELERGRRALAYHNFALVPLMVTDTLRDRAGRPASPYSRDALARLARFTQTGMRNPAELAAIAGATQDRPNNRNYSVWAYLAAARIPGFQPESAQREKPPSERWIGGSVAYFVR